MNEWKESYRKQIALRGDACDELYSNSERVLIEGHRGVRALVPENTIASFEAAIKMGVDLLETDVHMTRDNVSVLCHDSTVDRTTDGSGVIRSFTLEELKKLDAGARFGSGEFAGKGLTIPTLEEFCEFMDGHRDIYLNMEIKDYGLDNIDNTMATLGKYELLGNCVFACFDCSVIHYLFERYGVKTQGYVGRQMKKFVPGLTGTYSELYAVGLEMKHVNPENVAMLREMGIKPWCWCPDTAETVKYSIDCGVTEMCCNDPRPALEIIKGIKV